MDSSRKTFEGWLAEKLGANPDIVQALNKLSLEQSAELCRSAIVMIFKRDGVSSYAERMSDEAILIYYKGLDTEDLERNILAELELQSKGSRGRILRMLAYERGIKKKNSGRPSDRTRMNVPPSDKVSDDHFFVSGKSPIPPKSDPARRRPEDDPIIRAAIERASLRPRGHDYAEVLRHSTSPPPAVPRSDPPTHSSIRPVQQSIRPTTIIPPGSELAKRQKKI